MMQDLKYTYQHPTHACTFTGVEEETLSEVLSGTMLAHMGDACWSVFPCMQQNFDAR